MTADMRILIDLLMLRGLNRRERREFRISLTLTIVFCALMYVLICVLY